MKKLFLLVTLALQINIFPQTTFPLEIGTKWYYQAHHYSDFSQTDNYYYGIIKEVTDSFSDGTKEITEKYIFKDSVVQKENIGLLRMAGFILLIIVHVYMIIIFMMKIWVKTHVLLVICRIFVGVKLIIKYFWCFQLWTILFAN